MLQVENGVKVSWSNYGKYSGGNYGVHSLCFKVGGRTYFFSYRTLVAVDDLEKGLIVSKNYWGTTTGKHLNWICIDKSRRLDSEAFAAKLAELGINAE